LEKFSQISPNIGKEISRLRARPRGVWCAEDMGWGEARMNGGMDDWGAKHCKPCEGGTPPMQAARIQEFLKRLDGWEYVRGEIARTFTFKNYYQTMAFVNAVAWISHREDHHPEMEVGYKTCRVRYRTHSINGISENDFICAAKVSALTV
jgi:4a-hydroxytetrahydrobiopterin dehydratase